VGPVCWDELADVWCGRFDHVAEYEECGEEKCGECFDERVLDADFGEAASAFSSESEPPDDGEVFVPGEGSVTVGAVRTWGDEVFTGGEAEDDDVEERTDDGSECEDEGEVDDEVSPGVDQIWVWLGHVGFEILLTAETAVPLLFFVCFTGSCFRWYLRFPHRGGVFGLFVRPGRGVGGNA